MITTSHSAPYEADSDEIRRAFVKSWANSDNIGYLSPQLYTSGGEGVPQLERWSRCRASWATSSGTCTRG